MDTGGRYEDTRGYRIFLIRQARGTVKRPMPQREFAELLRGVRGRNYDASEISIWENNKAQPSLDDTMDLAAVDPLQRGLVWLITGREGAETTTPPQNGAAEDTGQIKTPIKRITVQGQRVDTGRGGRGKRTG